jgi:hypothetical protein
MLLLLLSALFSWTLATYVAAPAGWIGGWYAAAWLVLFPFCWVSLRFSALLAALFASGQTAKAAEDAARMARRRVRWRLNAARIATAFAGMARSRINWPRLVHSQTARILEGVGDWEGMLKAAGRTARSSKSALDKVVALTMMLRALAMLGKREAFAAVFAGLEAIFSDEAGKYGKKSQKEREAVAYRPIARANYLRGLMAYRDADFADAAHWLKRARQLDPNDPEPIHLLVEIAGWEEDEEAGRIYLRQAWENAEKPSEQESEMYATFREALLRAARRDNAGPEAEAEAERQAKAVMTQAADNARWQAAWAEIRLWALLRKPGRIQAVIDEREELAERHPRGRVEVRLGKMLAAALRREGNAMEAPYAELLPMARWTMIPAALRSEIPLWRALALIYRGQFTAALQKFDEIRAMPDVEAPKLTRLLADAYTAHCYDRLGESSKGAPFRESAKALAPEKCRIHALKLSKKARLEA